MPGYTLRNLDDVEDQAVKGGMSPNLEFRMARDDLELERSAISYLRLAPNFRMPFGHTHKEQEEVYVLLAGSARVRLDDETLELRQRDLLRVAPHTTRAFEAGPHGAEIIAIGAPKTPPGDAETVPNWWGD